MRKKTLRKKMLPKTLLSYFQEQKMFPVRGKTPCERAVSKTLCSIEKAWKHSLETSKTLRDMREATLRERFMLDTLSIQISVFMDELGCIQKRIREDREK